MTGRAVAARAALRSLPVAVLQAAYYAISGSWPLVSYRTFELVTGRKREPWLVKTVGLITLAIAATLAIHGRGERDAGMRTLGISSGLAYAGVDVWYAGVRRRISPVYLLDALVEIAFVGVWLMQPRSRGRS